MDNIELLFGLPKDRKEFDWHINFSNGKTLEGVVEGFDWLID